MEEGLRRLEDWLKTSDVKDDLKWNKMKKGTSFIKALK
jgi:hypothetical protein